MPAPVLLQIDRVGADPGAAPAVPMAAPMTWSADVRGVAVEVKLQSQSVAQLHIEWQLA